MEAELLEAIRRAPKDDAPRLVYADWLQERGDARGEFIQVQCALARAPGDASLAARARELQDAHEAAWMGPLAHPMIRWHFERGFPLSFGHAGLFMARQDPELYTRYLRFYPPGGERSRGVALSATSSGTPREVGLWFTPTHHGIFQGSFRVDLRGDASADYEAVLRFSTGSSEGADLAKRNSVAYTGSLRGGTMTLSWHSNINGRDGTDDYVLVDADGCDSRFPPAR